MYQWIWEIDDPPCVATRKVGDGREYLNETFGMSSQMRDVIQQ